MKLLENKLIKIISWLLSACFIFVFVLNDYAHANEYINMPKPINIPFEYGQVVERFNLADRSEQVVLVQDLHVNYEAQNNIKNIITHLSKNYKINKIGLEGTNKKETIDTTLISTIPDEKVKKESVDYFMKRGVIKGAEAFAALSKKSQQLVGIEDAKLYEDNKNLLLSSLNHRPEMVGYLQQIKYQLRIVEDKTLSSDIKKFRNHYILYKQDKLSVATFHKYLKQWAEISGKSIGSISPEYSKYTVLTQKRNSLNDKAVAKEYKNLLKQLNLNDNSAISKFKSFFRNPESVQKQMLEVIYSDKRYSNLRKYIECAELSRKINIQKLVTEENKVIKTIGNALCKNNTEKDLLYVMDYVQVLIKFLLNQLTRKELDNFYNTATEFEERFNSISSANKKELNILDSLLMRLKPYIEEMGSFYNIACKRDEAFINNFIANASQKEKNIMVTGGFHTVGIAKKLKEQNIPYVVISPRVTNHTQEDTKTYYALLRGDQALTFDEILKDQTLALPSFLKAYEEQIKFNAMLRLNTEESMKWAKQSNGEVAIDKFKNEKGETILIAKHGNEDTWGIKFNKKENPVSQLTAEEIKELRKNTVKSIDDNDNDDDRSTGLKDTILRILNMNVDGIISKIKLDFITFMMLLSTMSVRISSNGKVISDHELAFYVFFMPVLLIWFIASELFNKPQEQETKPEILEQAKFSLEETIKLYKERADKLIKESKDDWIKKELNLTQYKLNDILKMIDEQTTLSEISKLSDKTRTLCELVDIVYINMGGFKNQKSTKLAKEPAERKINNADIIKNAAELLMKELENIITRAEEVLNRKLSESEKQAIIEAHKIGEGEKGTDGGSARIGFYTLSQLQRKAEILAATGFTEGDRRILIGEGVAGRYYGPSDTYGDGLRAFRQYVMDLQWNRKDFYYDLAGEAAAERFGYPKEFAIYYEKLNNAVGEEDSNYKKEIIQLAKVIAGNDVENKNFIDSKSFRKYIYEKLEDGGFFSKSMSGRKAAKLFGYDVGFAYYYDKLVNKVKDYERNGEASRSLVISYAKEILRNKASKHINPKDGYVEKYAEAIERIGADNLEKVDYLVFLDELKGEKEDIIDFLRVLKIPANKIKEISENITSLLEKETFNMQLVDEIIGANAVRDDENDLNILVDRSADVTETMLHELVEIVLERAGIDNPHIYAFMVETELYSESIYQKLANYDDDHLKRIINDTEKEINDITALAETGQLAKELAERKINNADKINKAAEILLEHRDNEYVHIQGEKLRLKKGTIDLLNEMRVDNSETVEKILDIAVKTNDLEVRQGDAEIKYLLHLMLPINEAQKGFGFGHIIENYKTEMADRNMQRAMSKIYSKDLGGVKIRPALKTEFKDGILAVDRNVLRRIIMADIKYPESHVGSYVLSRMIQGRISENEEGQEFFDSYMKGMTTDEDKIMAFAVPLWLENYFGSDSLKREDVKEYVSKLAGLEANDVLSDKLTAAVDRMMDMESILGKQQIFEPGSRGAIEVTEEKKAYLQLKSGVRRIVEMFNRIRTAAIAVPIVAFDTFNTLTPTKRFDALLESALYGNRTMSMEYILERLSGILSGRKEQPIVPNPNKIAAVLQAT
jgi:hypothetical protein